MPETKHYTAKHLFTGEEWLANQAIVVEDGAIQDILPASSERSDQSFHTLLPAFIDLQIYGAFGKLFSVFPEAETLALIHQYCMEGGAFWFQPTVATNTKEMIFGCIDGVRSYWEKGGKGCLGLHVEGPWISKEKRGAHIESLVHAPILEETKELLEYGKDVIKMVTLAPEVCSSEVIELIQSSGVVIAAGHSNATYQQANAGFEKGIATVTHLYNAMSGLMHREVGLAGAAMLNKHVSASIIADGYHVDFAAIKIAHQIMQSRLFLVTDAVTETREGSYPHRKEGDKYVASGILSGSALTMMQAVRNMINKVGADKSEAIKMACTYPAKAAKLEQSIGRIAKGFPAYFIATDEELSFVKMVE